MSIPTVALLLDILYLWGLWLRRWNLHHKIQMHTLEVQVTQPLAVRDERGQVYHYLKVVLISCAAKLVTV